MNKEKLLKLADHLEHGKLGHQVFDFSIYNDVPYRTPGGKCGYAGCAIGECPFVFPDKWCFSQYNSEPVLRSRDNEKFPGYPGDSISCACMFFGLTSTQAKHLFVPTAQLKRFGGVTLTRYASRLEVANNIRAFITTIETGTPCVI